MGKKSSLTAKIAGITDGGANTAAEVRALLTEFINDTFSTPINDSLIIQSQITAIPNPDILSGSAFLNIWFKRVGNEVIISGRMENQTSGPLTPYKMAFIKADSEFLPDDRTDPVTGAPYVFRFDAESVNGEKVRMCVRTVSEVAYIETLSYWNTSLGALYIKNGRYDAKD